MMKDKNGSTIKNQQNPKIQHKNGGKTTGPNQSKKQVKRHFTCF